MRTLLWIVAIAALAVGLTLAARYNTGYVLLVLPPYRVEFSLNLLLVLLRRWGLPLGYALVRFGFRHAAPAAAGARVPARAAPGKGAGDAARSAA